ncbi:DUF5054 domain-containing protein [Rathayibacter soli]|uniref:DUF5054 domain-containing protein n=1 Tax=Rathayibacter soli TaxID=3144168 RepID=UPI0027E5BD9E|nr:DUF5054 domain-containing protein [Glaciibacter superstes]
MIKTVHVVFKTHLDLGFTGYAADVVDKYENDYIPKAIALAEQLAESDSGTSFIWTTGSWLINHVLEAGSPAQVEQLERAIRAGHIAWHGLPVSTHTEAMDPLLFDYGLSIAARLDRRFGITTTSAKMTDVPGHTIGMVPLLARAGIRYLHLGVNPASAVPDVPPAFVWQAEDGSEVVVSYDAAYGSAVPGQATELDGCEGALYLAFTNDNTGPPTPEDIAALFDLLKQKYPEATVRASTLEAYAKDIMAIRERLPILTEEIGDTWIHGIASDPLRVSQFRELLRLRTAWVADGRIIVGTPEYNAFSDPLLLVAEHTWGEDLKTFLPDFVNYAKTDFQRARAADAEHLYSDFERSWQEQRDRITQAIDGLEDNKRHEAQQALQALTATAANAQMDPIGVNSTHRLGNFEVVFDSDGSVASLVDSTGTQWAGPENALGAYTYQTFGAGDYERWIREYCRDLSVTGDWALADFGKPGFEYVDPQPKNATYRPRVEMLGSTSSSSGDTVRIELGMPPEATDQFGAPRRIVIVYFFDATEPTIDITLSLEGKDANRLPEASWFAINPRVANPNLWKIDKLGVWVDPSQVVRNGNRNLHAVLSGAHYADSSSTVDIKTLDAPVVAIGEPRILAFDNRFGDPARGFHFNLQNNVWGTNFMMWFEENVNYRFQLTLATTHRRIDTSKAK